ncbi:MAG: discoidin domain-containing protein, partial [Terrimonas sp.]|nr:discoidin domain-containing protein [Terrimonas sp.]
MKKHLQFVLAALLTFFCFTNNLLAQTNVALNQTAIASSIESNAYPASGAIDGNGSTRWSSAFNNNQWIYIDLGEAYNLTEVRLTWETARGLDFDIDISNDAITWITVQSIRGNSDFNNVIDVSGYAARYVRMNGLVRATQYGFSLFEFEVYGAPVDNTPIVNLALNKSSSVSSLENATMLSAYAFDGLGTNVGAGGKAYDGSSVEYGRWASEYSDPQWISVDLGGV